MPHILISYASVQDCVPKAIMHFLVHRSERGMQQHLIQSLYKEELLEALMQVCMMVSFDKRNCIASIQSLHSV